jgi:hypothetical protein
VSGSLEVTGQAGWVLAPAACSNGDTRQFYGVDLVGGSGAVRLFQDPVLGWVAGVSRRGDPGMPDERLAPAACARFDAALDLDTCGRCTKNDHDEDDSTMTGHVDLDCPWGGGGDRIRGRIDFANCDNPEED